MAAKDYHICLGLANVYLAKVSKSDPKRMLDDRRPVEESEILSLIHWWASQKKEVNGNDIQCITAGGEVVVEVKLIKPMDD